MKLNTTIPLDLTPLEAVIYARENMLINQEVDEDFKRKTGFNNKDEKNVYSRFYLRQRKTDLQREQQRERSRKFYENNKQLIYERRKQLVSTQMDTEYKRRYRAKKKEMEKQKFDGYEETKTEN